MKVPVSYSFRNLWTRRLTTILTAAGMALVVFVFAAILMLAEGLQKTLVDTGSWDNVVLIRKGSQSEVQSGIERLQASVIETQPEVAVGEGGRRVLAKEVVVLISLAKRGTDKPSNDIIRGVNEQSLAKRPQVSLLEGRMPGLALPRSWPRKSVARRFRGRRIGETRRFGMRDWTVVGIFTRGSRGSAPRSGGTRITHADLPAPGLLVVNFKLSDPPLRRLQGRVESDPRLTVEAKRRRAFYADQSR
jgi:hypothetical protein